MAADGVDHQRDHSGVNAVSFEVGALGHGAGDDGGGRCAENGLEHDVDPQREIEPQVRVISLNERVEPADQSACATEHDAEADEPVARGANAEIHHILHKNIAGIFGTRKSGLTHCKTSLHKINKCGSK